MKEPVWKIKDSFHAFINGNETPDVLSDNPAFENIHDFLRWCKQHGAIQEIEEVSENNDFLVYKSD